MNKEEIIKNLKNLWLGIDIINNFIPEDTKDKIDLETIDETLKLIEKQQADINKLINYIAIKEDLDFKQVVEKFELGDYK